MGLPRVENSALELDSFNAGIFSFAERVEYRRVQSAEDFEEIGRLRSASFNFHKVYKEPCPEVMIDETDYAPSCYCFGIYVDGVIKATLRLEHITLNSPESMVTQFFPDVVLPLLDQGLTFFAPGRFATVTDWDARDIALQLMTLRLTGMALQFFDASALLNMIRSHHAAYNRRFFNATQMTPLRDIDGVTDQMFIYQFPFSNIEGISKRYPFYRSLEVERRLLFGEDKLGQPKVLTVMPTCYEANFMPNPKRFGRLAS